MSSPSVEKKLPAPDNRRAEIHGKLKELEKNDTETFFLLVRSARVSTFVVKRCVSFVGQCSREHPACGDTGPFLGLVKSINELREAEIEPEVRQIILESITSHLIMPKLKIEESA